MRKLGEFTAGWVSHSQTSSIQASVYTELDKLLGDEPTYCLESRRSPVDSYPRVQYTGSSQTTLRGGLDSRHYSEYATWQQGDAETTLVLSVLWSILIGALWTTQLDLILPAVVVTTIAYFTWETLRGGWERPV